MPYYERNEYCDEEHSDESISVNRVMSWKLIPAGSQRSGLIAQWDTFWLNSEQHWKRQPDLIEEAIRRLRSLG